jgi:hypothetical protein
MVGRFINQFLFDILYDHFNSNLVLDTTRYYDISDLSLRFYVFFKVRFDKCEPLLDTTFNISVSIANISDN